MKKRPLQDCNGTNTFGANVNKLILMIWVVGTVGINLTGCATVSKETQSNHSAYTEYSELKGFCKGGCRVQFAEDNLASVWIYNQNGLAKFDGSKIDSLDLKGILTSNNIHAIQLDGAGLLWVATDNELCRFDGKEWKKFSKADGFENSTIWNIIIDNKGVLWFNTLTHGVYKYENDQFTKFTPGGIANNDNLRLLGYNHQMAQWFVFNDKDIYRLEDNRLIEVAKGAIPASFFGLPTANSILRVTRTNDLLLALSGKVYRVKKDGLKQIPGIETEGWFSDQKITCLFEDSRGTLWVGHGAIESILNKAGGVYRVEGDNVEHIDADTKKSLIWNIFEDSEGKLWFSSIQGFSGRLQHLEGKAWETVFDRDLGDGVGTLFEDSRHNFWFGIASEGKFIHYCPNHKSVGSDHVN